MKKLVFLLFMAALLPVLAEAGIEIGKILPDGNVAFEEPVGIKKTVEAVYIKPDGGYVSVEENCLIENTTDKDITAEIFCAGKSYGIHDDINSYATILREYNPEFKFWVNGAERNYEIYYSVFSKDINITKYVKDFFDSREYYKMIYGKELSEYIDTMKSADRNFLLRKKIILSASEKAEKDHALPEDYKKYKWHNNDWKRRVYFHWKQTFPAGKKVHVKYTYVREPFHMRKGGSGTFVFNSRDELREAAGEEVWAYERNEWDFYYGFKNHGGPVKSFNLLVEGPWKIAISFKKPQVSKDEFAAFDLQNLADAGWNFEFLMKDFDLYDLIKNTDKERVNWGSVFTKPYIIYPTKEEREILNTRPKVTEFYKNRKYSNAKLYRANAAAAILDKPEGKKAATIEKGADLWVVEEKGDWRRIVYNEIRGWTHKKNLTDIWDVGK